MRNTTMIRRIMHVAAAFGMVIALGACADQPMEVETPTDVQMDGQGSGGGECVIIGGVMHCPG